MFAGNSDPKVGMFHSSYKGSGCWEKTSVLAILSTGRPIPGLKMFGLGNLMPWRYVLALPTPKPHP